MKQQQAEDESLTLRRPRETFTGAVVSRLQNPTNRVTKLELIVYYDDRDHNLSLDQLEELCSVLKHSNNKITHLNLDGNRLGAASTRLLSKALQHPNNKVSSLNLGSNGVGAEGAEILAGLLEHPNNKITHLNLWVNLLGDAGIQLLLKGLEHQNNQVSLLNLNWNGVGPEGAEVLARLLGSPNCKITHLSLSSNKKMSDAGAQAIFHAARRVKSLELSWCGLTDAALSDSLQHLFRNNTVLSSLNLSVNKISAIPLDAVKAHRPEIEIDLRANDAMIFPPRHIAEAGRQAVSQFFADIREGCLPVSWVNVLLVGDGGVGKTTLKMKALLGQEPLSADLSSWCEKEAEVWLRQCNFTSEEISQLLNEENENVDAVLYFIRKKDGSEGFQLSELTQLERLGMAFKKQLKFLYHESLAALRDGKPWIRVSTTGIDAIRARAKVAAGHQSDVFQVVSSAALDAAGSGSSKPVDGRCVGSPPMEMKQDPDQDQDQHLELYIQDYAGQSQYYTTNQLFMSGCLGTFVVVAQAMKVMDKNVKPEPARQANPLSDILLEWDYWLCYISAIYPLHAPAPAKAHVILALTHLDEKHGRQLSADERKRMDEWQARARKRYGNIHFHALIHLNYDHPQSCMDLRKAVVESCQAVCASVYVPVTFEALLVRMDRLVELKRQAAVMSSSSSNNNNSNNNSSSSTEQQQH